MGELLDRVLPRQIRESYLWTFAVVLGSILLIVGMASLAFYIGVSGMVEDDAQNQLEGNTENQAEELNNWVESNERNARLLSELDVMEEGDQSRIQGTMINQLRALPSSVQSVHFVSFQDNEIRYSINPEARGTDLDELDADVHVRNPGSVEEMPLTDVQASEIDTTYTDTFEWQNSTVVGFLSPVSDGSGNAIMITVDMEYVGSPFYEPIDGGYTEVVDQEDGDVMMSDTSDRLGETYHGGTDDEVVQNADLEATVTERDGELLAYASPGQVDWVLVSHSPQDEAYAVASTVQRALLVLIGIVLVGFVALGATMGRSTATALESLADDAEELSRGNLDVEIADSGRIDEVGQVEASFRETQTYLQTVAQQAEALADGSFDSDVFEEEIPGDLGQSLTTMRTDLQQYVEEVEASQAEAREARKEAETLAEELQAEAAAFGETVTHAADGDLTRRLDNDVENEAMRTIADSFNEMLDGLEPMIVDLQSLAEEVDEASVDVSTGAEEIDRASDGVSESAEEISAATQEQTERFGEVQSEMGQLSAIIEEVASTSDEVATAARHAAENTDDVAVQSAQIIEEMDELETVAQEIVTEIEALGEEIDRISTVVDVIDDIAEQTGILALNASIEAARADGAAGSGDGDGFAVIADEVKSLADETADSTEEIETLIDEVRDSATEVIEDATAMQDRVEQSAEQVQSGMAAIEEVNDSVDDVSSRVQTVSEATDEQAATAEEVVTMVDQATENSERTNGEAENVAVAIEEQSASTTQVSQTAGELSEAAERLRDALDAFEVRTEADIDADSGADPSTPAAEGSDDEPTAGGEATADDGGQPPAVDSGDKEVPAIESGREVDGETPEEGTTNVDD